MPLASPSIYKNITLLIKEFTIMANLTHTEEQQLLYKALAYIANSERTDDFKDFMREQREAPGAQLAAEMLAWEIYNAV